MILSILICSIPHRDGKLRALLDALAPQIYNDGRHQVEVIVFRDNLETPWTTKCNRLLEAATGEYVVHIDDDDLVAPDYVSKILDALASKPDYVGFKVRYTKDGTDQINVIHSLKYGGWFDTPNCLYRDITDKNPIKRSLAKMATWQGGNGADRDWAEQLRGFVRTEEYIPEELYYYQLDTSDTFLSGREPMENPPPRPAEYPFVLWL